MNIRAREAVREDCVKAFESSSLKIDLLKNSKLVITGGTGFVGSWLVEMLSILNDDHGFNTEVFVIARDIEKFKREKPHLYNRADVSTLSIDIKYPFELPRGTNWLIHAAGIPSSRFHAVYPIETISTIGEGTINLLRAVEVCSNINMILNLSSGWITGTQPFDLPCVSEEFNGVPIQKQIESVYVDSKRYAEAVCSAFRGQSRLPIVNVRPFSFIGPYQELDSPWAINNFIRDALLGNVIQINGDGSSVRSYMYGSDLAIWLLHMLVNAKSGECYNVGSSEGVALVDLAKIVSDQASDQPKISMRFSSKDFRSRFVPCTKLAESKFGLKITTPLPEAIERTLLWHKLIRN